jgi:hypothetical protein
MVIEHPHLKSGSPGNAETAAGEIRKRGGICPQIRQCEFTNANSTSYSYPFAPDELPT